MYMILLYYANLQSRFYLYPRKVMAQACPYLKCAYPKTTFHLTSENNMLSTFYINL